MFQFAFEAVLFKFNARTPSMRPLLQLPNRRATAQGDADPIPFYKNPLQFTFCKVQISLGEDPQTPYAATPTGGNRRMAHPMSQYAIDAV